MQFMLYLAKLNENGGYMANKAKESARLREERIAGTSNGMTLRTRVVRDRKKYSRKIKHSKKSIAEAMDFARIWRQR